MTMDILKLNPISTKANDVLKGYNLVTESNNPTAVLVRSFNMNEWDLPSSVLAVGRAGAGVNNIPHADYAKRGVCVFNTPGANANGVKELVIASLILASRNLFPAMSWAQTLTGDDVAKQVEKGKSKFVGTEILGKTLCVLGLGAIGRKVASSAHALGMKVVAYAPRYHEVFDTEVPFVKVYDNLDDAVKDADFVSIHIPYKPDTKHTINGEKLALMKDGVIVVNSARAELVDIDAMKDSLDGGKVRAYVVDFPTAESLGDDRISAIPHLGASTEESEDNCAVMASESIKEYIEKGNVINSVNMPNIVVEPRMKHRYTIISNADLDFEGVSEVKNGIRYTIIDTDKLLDEGAFNLDGVIKLRRVF